MRFLVLVALVPFAVACEAREPDLWVESLPPRTDGAPPVDGHASWIDLLEAPVTPADAVRVEDVERVPPALEESARDEMLRAREHASRVLSDQRRAWVSAPLSERREHSVDVPGSGTLRLAFSVDWGDAGPPAADDARAHFAIELDPGDGRRRIASGAIAVGDLEGWREVRTEVPGAGRLYFSAHLTHASDDARAAFATPSIQREASRMPDVVLVSVDTLRADRLGCYGYERDTSPNIDRLAQRGVVFERCISQAPWTLPSYGSLFTSLFPSEHRAGVTERAELWAGAVAPEDLEQETERMSASAPTLAGELRSAGYRTAGIYFNPYLNPRAGVARGFDEYVWLRYGARAGVERAQAWLDRTEGLPRFLFLHLIDPHWPYAPPVPYDERFAGRSVDSLSGYPWGMKATRNDPPPPARRELLSGLYDGEIAYADAELAPLFERLERSGALVVFHSDHGEELWDHGQFEHGHSMHEELLRVPLVVAFPAQLRPARVGAQVRAIDVFPTILDLLGLERPDGLRGTSLVPLARGDVDGVQLVSFSESILHGRPYARFDEAKALTADGWTIVVGDGDAATPVLWELGQSPPESVDVAARHSDVTERLHRRLVDTFAEATLRAADSGAIEFSDAQREGLDNLGYLGGE